jgi:hypothetical protein
MTATNIRNEAEAQRATNEARAEAQSDEPPADRRSYGNEGAGASNGSTATTKSEESEDSAGKTPFDALREFVNLFDMTCGQGRARLPQSFGSTLHRNSTHRACVRGQGWPWCL